MTTRDDLAAVREALGGCLALHGFREDCPACVGWREAHDALARLAARLEETEERYLAAESKAIFHDDAMALATRLEEALRAAQQLQPKRMQWFRDKEIVFARAPLREAPADDGERWEQIAFLIYIDLCEVESIASAALGEDKP